MKAALKSRSKFRLGAVVVKRGRVISTGWNQMEKTHPLTLRYSTKPKILLGLHAEIHAGLRAGLKLPGSEVYVVRLYKDNSFATSKPCGMCENFLRAAQVRKVWFISFNGELTYSTL